LVGLHVLPHRLTGNNNRDFDDYHLPEDDNHHSHRRGNLKSYNRDFLLHDLLKLLEIVPLAVKAQMQYMHDGASAHFSRAVVM
jgi:hypothetical protein